MSYVGQLRGGRSAMISSETWGVVCVMTVRVVQANLLRLVSALRVFCA